MEFTHRMNLNFEGSDMTLDAGLALYKEFDHKLGLPETVKELLVVQDTTPH